VAFHHDVIVHKIESSPASAKQHLQQLRKDVERYIRETRQSIWDLRSPMLEEGDLVRAVRETCRTLAATRNVPVDLMIDGLPHRMDVKTEEHILRICHEAVANAVRHSDGAHVQVELRYSADSLVLRVCDNGPGFDPNSRRDGCWGLIDMAERAQCIRASFTLTTAPGHGTTVEAAVPMPRHT
jgi:signal transduction histidine kinase